MFDSNNRMVFSGMMLILLALAFPQLCTAQVVAVGPDVAEDGTDDEKGIIPLVNFFP